MMKRMMVMIFAGILCGILVSIGSAEPSKDTVFQLTKPDGTSVNFTMEILKKLPLSKIMVSGKPQEGPSLLDVLKYAEIKDFKQITILGLKAASLTLKKEEVTAEVLLDFTNRGTVKLASPKLPIPSPIKDITIMKVE